MAVLAYGKLYIEALLNLHFLLMLDLDLRRSHHGIVCFFRSKTITQTLFFFILKRGGDCLVKVIIIDNREFFLPPRFFFFFGTRNKCIVHWSFLALRAISNRLFLFLQQRICIIYSVYLHGQSHTLRRLHEHFWPSLNVSPVTLLCTVSSEFATCSLSPPMSKLLFLLLNCLRYMRCLLTLMGAE